MTRIFAILFVALAVSACGGGSDGGGGKLADLGIAPSQLPDAGSSYTNSVPADVRLNYLSLERPAGTGDLRDAIAYLDANGDGSTDIFMGTGQFLSQDEVDCVLYVNDGANNFTATTEPFGGDMPKATHARKSLAADFDGDGRTDVVVLDHGFDANPFPGAQPKLALQVATGVFTWRRLADQTGFHNGGAAADIDADGDIDIFVGGFNPFFYVNDGAANFTKVDNRYDNSLSKIFTAELIDIDQDGFVDLLAGAHERDGDVARIYWGSSKGSYSRNNSFAVPAAPPFGAVLDFDAGDFDGDGDRDVLINRTRDGDDGEGAGFYQGATVQYLRNDGGRLFSDVTAAKIDFPGDGSNSWFPWIRVQNLDNDSGLDFGPDDLGRGFYFKNNGDGTFTRTGV